jgi:hypothetical protein
MFDSYSRNETTRSSVDVDWDVDPGFGLVFVKLSSHFRNGFEYSSVGRTENTGQLSV